MIFIDDFIAGFTEKFPELKNYQPWEITDNIKTFIESEILTLNDEFVIKNEIAIHKSAIIEAGVTIKKPAIIGENCFVGAHSYIREGAYLDRAVRIGPGSEIKSSILMESASVAHLNYVGNSILGKSINLEAGAVIANHYNEREEKSISVLHDQKIIDTKSEKFRSLIGDHTKIGANAVLSPGTVLHKSSVVKRLQLIEQIVPGDL